jgi:GxxExxY protein
VANEETESWSERVIGAAIAVHRTLGPGFLESVYEQALAVEFEARAIPFVRQASFAIEYRGRQVGEHRLDLLVANCLVVELKSVDSLGPIHMAQVLSYLRVTHHSLALLINFNVPVLKQGLRRIAL